MGGLRLADLPQRLSCTYPTAKSDITRLIAAGILSEVPGVRPKTHFARPSTKSPTSG